MCAVLSGQYATTPSPPPASTALWRGRHLSWAASHRGRRRRPRAVGSLGRQPGRVQGGGRRVCLGEVVPSSLEVSRLARSSADLSKLLELARLTRPGHRCRRHLRPGRLQRPAPAGSEGPDVGGGAAHPRRTPPGSQACRRFRGDLHFPLPVGLVTTTREPPSSTRSGGAGRLGDGLRCLVATGSAYGVVGAFGERRFPKRAYGGSGPVSCAGAASTTPGCSACCPILPTPGPTCSAASPPGESCTPTPGTHPQP